MRTARSATLLASGVLLAVTLGACGNARSSSAVAPTRSTTGSRTITREIISRWNVLDAYDVIERSGGYLLSSNDRGDVSVRQARGRSSIINRNADRPVLLVDGTMMHDFDMLRRIEAANIEEIIFLSSGDATQRFGTLSSGAGAIIVVTRSRPD